MTNMSLWALVTAVLLSCNMPLARAIYFSVNEGPRLCLMYNIEQHNHRPQIELKFISNLTGTSRAEHASRLRITAFDMNKNEILSTSLPPQSKNLASWVTVNPFSSSALSAQLNGDYSVCFTKERGVNQPSVMENAYVGILSGDLRVSEMLEKQSIATKGVSYISSADGSVASLTSDELEEFYEWVAELEGQLEEIFDNVERLTTRHEDFQVTSNSLFTRIWVMAVLTVVSMAATMFYMNAALLQTVREKKLI